jgi:dipeptidase
MIGLIERYGQGGNCGFDKKFYYDNSFLAADPNEAYVLETSGKNYAVIKVDGKYAISNRLSIGANHVARSGLKQGEDFKKRFTEPVFSHFSAAKSRRRQMMESLTPSSGAPEMMGILRNHDSKVQGKEFKRGSVSSVCMHAGRLIGDHATGSVVIALRPDKPITLWGTGCSTPCISAFKPLFWGSEGPPIFDDPSLSLKYWLRREHMHRAIIAGKIDATAFRSKIRTLEADWLERERQIMAANAPDRAEMTRLSSEAGSQEQTLIDEFYVDDWQIKKAKNRYERYWAEKNIKLTT